MKKENKKLLKRVTKSTDKMVEILNENSLRVIEEIKRNISTAQDEYKNLQKVIHEIQVQNDQTVMYFDKSLKKIDALGQETDEKYEKLQDKIDGSLKKIEVKYLYNNDYERKAISTFYEYFERKDFKELFLNLVRGLEEQDVDEIVKILQRQKIAKDTMQKDVDLFSSAEQRKILEMKKELETQILKVSDDMYCLKHYFLPINHFEPSVFYYKHGIDCIKNIESIREKDILDVGGFIGDSVLILKPLTNKRVFCFEGLQGHCDLIKQTVEMNHLDNIIVERMALGDCNTEIEMEVAGSASAIKTNGFVRVSGKERVPMRTLDSYIKEKKMDIGLIKVDIEGAEQLFLKGARKTIETYKPILLMSIYHNADDFFRIKPLIESWGLGYKFRIHKPIDYSVSREVLLIAEV